MKKEVINQNGVSELVDMSATEIAAFNEAAEKSTINALPILEHQNSINEKIEARRAVYEKLGLTAEETSILLS